MMDRSSVTAGLTALLATALVFSTADPSQAQEIRFEHDGRERRALVHLPAGRASDPNSEPLAVVLAYHGGGSGAEQFRSYAGLDRVADREGAIIVYPEGVSRKGRIAARLHTWNAGSCCGYANREKVDDVSFSLALLSRVAKRFPVDLTRVYATGHSNGAMMAYRLAAESAATVAAIAPVGGAMALDDFAPGVPVPVLHIHSKDDPRALYMGGLGPRFPMTRHRVQHNAVEKELGKWRTRNQCAKTAELVEERIAPADREDAGHRAKHLRFGPCASGAAVELWQLSGPGHPWPGPESLAFSRRPRWATAVGVPTAVVDAAEEAWAFFERFTRAPSDLTGPTAP